MRRISRHAERPCRLWLAGVLVLLVAGILPLKAQPDESYNYNPGRPGFTYGSTPLIRHTISAEANLAFMGDLFMERPFNESAWLKNRYTFRYSPLDRLELGIGVGLESYFFDEPTLTTLSPLTLMARINILRKEGYKPGLALIGELGLPVGAGLEHAVSRGVNPSAVIVLDHNYKRWGFYYNIGASWYVRDQATQLFYSFMVCCNPDAKGRWNIYGEVVGGNGWIWNEEYGGWDDAYSLCALDFRIGADFFITKNLKIDFSVATLLFDEELQAEIGIAYGIPLKKQRR